MSNVFFLSATVFREEKKKATFKMALRTICTFALRNGTDLRVNNTRTIVTTGYYGYYCYYGLFLKLLHCAKMWKYSFCICI